MEYSTFVPNSALQNLVEYYWMVEGNDSDPQKIIPDGCSEIIFHFGDRYKICQDDEGFQIQSLALLAGQIIQPIILQPTGSSGVLGIKFKPNGIWKLFGWNMKAVFNKTVSLKEFLAAEITDIILDEITNSSTHAERIKIVESFFIARLEHLEKDDRVTLLVEEIKSTLGQISVKDLSSKYKISRRMIERSFNEQVGISAKVYSRLIRFKNVFELLQKPELSRAEVTYISGYFDQAHFNKEFKMFSGEDPASYFKQNHAFSNFFMNS
jgi:AraC-like DNA-binding protein